MDINVFETVLNSEAITTTGEIGLSRSDSVEVLDGYRAFAENVVTSESETIKENIDIFQTETTNTSEFVGHYPDEVFTLEETEAIILNPFSQFKTELVPVTEFVHVSAPPHPFTTVWNNIIRIRVKNF